jgi:hypothetical protein
VEQQWRTWKRGLPTIPVLQRKANSLPDDFQVKKGDDSEHEEDNAS